MKVQVTFSNEGSVKSVLFYKHHEISGEMMLVSKAYSGQQWKQWQLEKEINEVSENSGDCTR